MQGHIHYFWVQLYYIKDKWSSKHFKMNEIGKWDNKAKLLLLISLSDANSAVSPFSSVKWLKRIFFMTALHWEEAPKEEGRKQ